jgi:hypothetical protein
LKVVINREYVRISNIYTHIAAEQIMKDVRDLLLDGGYGFTIYIEGEPGPRGDGFVIKLIFNKELGDAEISLLKNYFKLRKASITQEV